MNNRFFVILVAVLLAAVLYRPVHAQTLSVGLVREELSFDYLDQASALSAVIVHTVTEPLIALEQQGVRLKLSSGFEVSADGSEWKFRISPEKRFHTGAPVRPVDVLYSLERCLSSGQPFTISSFRSSLLGDGTTEVQIQLATQREEQPSKFFSRCPILEAASSLAFGQELGKATHLVGSGRYFISDFKGLSKISLRWIGPRPNPGKPFWAEIELRIFESSEQGLSALRSGALHLLFTESESVAKRVQNDETLFLQECSHYTLAVRSEVSMVCGSGLDLSKIVVRL